MNKNYFLNKKKIEFYPLKNLIIIRSEGQQKILKINEKTMIPEEIDSSELRFESPFMVSHDVDSIYGTIKLHEKTYFIVVTESTKVAKILNHYIFRADKFSFIPIQQNLNIKSINKNKKNPKQNTDQKFITLFLNFFNQKKFYYSNTYNLTNSLQSLISTNFKYTHNDPKFFINRFFIDQFIKSNINYQNFISTFIMGYVDQGQTTFMRESSLAEMTFISRKGVSRLGTRFFSRGADSNGNVSNFVETEQILVLNRKGDDLEKNRVFSYLQVRGSIPVLWTQKPTLSYRPEIIVEKDFEKNLKAYRTHFRQLMLKYGKIQCISLVDHKNGEKRIGDAFSKAHDTMLKDSNTHYKEKVNYIWFDYHRECKGMKMKNMIKLIESIKKNTQDYNYFESVYTPDPENPKKNIFTIKNYQNGVIRNNCKDCLDRTNVVQSVLGRHNFLQIFKSLNIMNFTTPLDPFSYPEFEKLFRNIWTNNADEMSILYAGTPALKTDFTRTGKRGYMGILNDGKNSVTRYVINNFEDYEKQNCYDFLVNNINVRNYEFYEIGKGRAFLKNSAVLGVLPFLIKIVFWGLGRRMNFLVVVVLFVLAFAILYYYLKENKNVFLDGTIMKEKN